VLRDYLTDLFPILEVGTSAKMLSIVPLMNGGGLFETGAGGSAPKHVEQFLQENYLRWDSLGEFFALAASASSTSAITSKHAKAKVLADTLDAANGKFLENDRSPGPQARHHRQPRQPLLPRALLGAGARRRRGRRRPAPPLSCPIAAEAHRLPRTQIVAELLAAQGKPVDVGGYYHPDDAKAAAALRPSATLNEVLARI
jgi:isocitrate dehydrogenase